MIKVSRRSLARYGADQLLAGRSARLVAKQLAASLVESNRVAETEYLLNDIAAELADRQTLSSSQVVSARPLSNELRRSLSAKLKQVTGAKQILLNESIDESLIGGLRVETTDHVWDSTISRKLQLLKEQTDA